MKAMLRRAHLTVDVVTAQGERKSLTLSVRPGPGFVGLVAALIVQVAKAHGHELVDELEQPFPSSPDVASNLTVPVVVVPPHDSLPPAPAAASPSVAVASTGDFAPALKRGRVFGNARSRANEPPRDGVHIVRDAHRRIEATRESGADVVIGPRDMAPVNGGTLRVSSAHVVGQSPLQSTPAGVAPSLFPERKGQRPAAPVPADAPAPDATAPVIKRRR